MLVLLMFVAAPFAAISTQGLRSSPGGLIFSASIIENSPKTRNKTARQGEEGWRRRFFLSRNLLIAHTEPGSAPVANLFPHGARRFSLKRPTRSRRLSIQLLNSYPLGILVGCR
jgi:hypothetical protein